jgi:hypothetical protein
MGARLLPRPNYVLGGRRRGMVGEVFAVYEVNKHGAACVEK